MRGGGGGGGGVWRRLCASLKKRRKRRKGHHQSNMRFQFDKNTHKVPSELATDKKKYSKLEEVRFVPLPLQSIKDHVRTIEIGKQRVMYACIY